MGKAYIFDHPLIQHNKWRLVNAFLIPNQMPKVCVEQVISVRCSLFQEAKIQDKDGITFEIAPIQTLLLNPQQLFTHYLNGDCGYLKNPLLKPLKPIDVLI